jgi:hypothetical protein
LEDDEDTVTETSKDSPHLEWWEEAKRKSEEEDEMIEEQGGVDGVLRDCEREERTCVFAALTIRPHRPAMYRRARSLLSKYSTRLRGFGRRKALEWVASWSMKGEAATADMVVISSDENE